MFSVQKSLGQISSLVSQRHTCDTETQSFPPLHGRESFHREGSGICNLSASDSRVSTSEFRLFPECLCRCQLTVTGTDSSQIAVLQQFASHRSRCSRIPICNASCAALPLAPGLRIEKSSWTWTRVCALARSGPARAARPPGQRGAPFRSRGPGPRVGWKLASLVQAAARRQCQALTQ